MCLDHEPPAVAEALAAYRGIVESNGPNWTESDRSYYGPLVKYFRLVDFGALMTQAVMASLAAGASMAEAMDGAVELDMDCVFRDTLGDEVPDGLLVLRWTGEGRTWLTPGPVHPVLPGETMPFLLLVDNRSEQEVTGAFGMVPAGRALTLPVTAGAGIPVLEGEEPPPVVREAEKATLRLRSPLPCRWSVLSPSGRGWFPEGAPRKWDAHGRAYFHGTDLVLDVPAEELTVLAARGMDFGTDTAAITPKTGEETVVELDPPRLRDPAARGWYGGDLHLHLHFAGDQVLTPAQAGAMQHGEALHVMNPLAANATTSFVYDRAMLTEWIGRDLPWSDGDHVARMGAEYRNDLLGHVAAFGLTSEPPRYYSGHEESDAPADRPPNARLCAALRERDAVITWAHPLILDTGEPLDALFGTGTRSTECRELVADAALGLVDGLDVLTHLSCTGTAKVYRRLLGAGVHLAVTAGTDVMLSYEKMATYSNPPGWARVYARLDGPLSVPAYQEAVRACRTFATNGPWLTLDVAGEGPGGAVTAEPGQWLSVRCSAPGADRVRVYDAEGIVAEGPGHVDFAYDVRYPTYLVAEADGAPDPGNLDPRGPYAHTSAVHVEVAGRRVARMDDLLWCLDWIDRLEAHVCAHAADPDPDLFTVLDEARAVYRARMTAT